MLKTKNNSACYTRMAQPIRSVLVATDLSRSSWKAVQYAIALARRYDAIVHFLYVVSSLGYTLCGPDVAEHARQLACREIDDLETALVCSGALKGLRSRFAVRAGEIAGAVEEYASEQQIDVIVIGTHRRHGFSHLALGSVGERILRRTTRPVLTASAKTNGPVLNTKGIDHVLFATDFGEGSLVALSYAGSIAAQFGATLSMLHVTPSSEPERGHSLGIPIESPLQRLRELSKSAGELDILHLVEAGEVAESILRIARAVCANLIVMGLKKATYLAMAVRYPGSIVHRVVSDACCPVLTIRS